MRKSILFLAVLGLLTAISCGRDSSNCFNVGPFGDCGDKYPDSNKTGTRTGGALSARTNKGTYKVGEVIEVIVEGGATPYILKSRGSYAAQSKKDGTLPPENVNSKFFKAASVTPENGSGSIEIEDNNGANPSTEMEVFFKIVP